MHQNVTGNNSNEQVIVRPSDTVYSNTMYIVL